MSATVHYLRPFRLVGRPCGNGTSFEPPCREIDDLPEHQRAQVRALLSTSRLGVACDPDRDPPPPAAA